MLSVNEWHQRFIQQSNWTTEIRKHLIGKAKFNQDDKILEVGCGTGAILNNIKETDHIHGLDIDLERLQFAQGICRQAILTCGDGHILPFKHHTFDVLICHFLLLWVTDPSRVINEMIRVGKPGGKLLFLAEPDYNGRIDHPDELTEIGKAQTESLKKQGADVKMGRKLAGLLADAGLLKIEIGLLGGQWNTEFSKKEWELEWKVIESDIFKLFPKNKLKDLRKIDNKASIDGSRILFVPTFYAYGIIP